MCKGRRIGGKCWHGRPLCDTKVGPPGEREFFLVLQELEAI
jgi:hypothetical protein